MYVKRYNASIDLMTVTLEGKREQQRYDDLGHLECEHGFELNEEYYKDGAKISELELNRILHEGKLENIRREMKKLEDSYNAKLKEFTKTKESLEAILKEEVALENGKLESGKYVEIITRGLNMPVEIKGIVEDITETRIKLKNSESISFAEIEQINVILGT